MLKNFSFLILFLFNQRGNSQVINLSDSIITSKGVAGLSFNNNIDSIKKRNANYLFLDTYSSVFGIDANLLGTLVLDKNEPLFYLCPQLLNKQLVGGFEIISNRFVSPKGVSTKNAIKDYQILNIEFSLSRDEFIENEEFFELKDIKNLYGGSYFSASLRFQSQVEKKIGMYKTNKSKETTKRFNDLNVKSSRISLIRIQ